MKIKALSFRQPWAELVLQGRKTLDLRTWSTRYRGPLAVYASQTVEKEHCFEYGLDPGALTAGAVIGIVDLIDVVELDEATYASRAAEHLGVRHFRPPRFGWELANPRTLAEPAPARGRLLLFEVEIPGAATEGERDALPAPAPADANSTELQPDGLWGESAPFEMRVVPESDTKAGGFSYRLAIYQRRVAPPAAQRSLYRQDPEQMEHLVELGGVPLRAVADQVLAALRENGYKATDLALGRREPFALQEEWGVRLALLFLATKPITKIRRIEAISAGIREMTSEELYYWFSKCTSHARAERAQKALRALLADE